MSWFLLTILYVESMEYDDVVYRSREKEIIKVRERKKQKQTSNLVMKLLIGMILHHPYSYESVRLCIMQQCN